MPQIVRLPYSSFSVANMDAITDQSRVPGLVTIGPTIIVDVAARIRGYSTNVSCQSTCESNVHPYPNPASSARFIIATTPLAGGLGCSTTPNSITPPIGFAEGVEPRPVQTRYWLRPRDRKAPWPPEPLNSPSATTTWPREIVVATLPVICIPS